MTPRLSVVICTYNPRPDYFARVLGALRAQSMPVRDWELVVVDNRSQDPVAARADLSWHPGARHVREETLGLTPGRLRGIRESAAPLLVFVDDDNVLDADYLETADRIANERPFLGSWSGQCRPEFERPAPEWTRRYWGNLALREFGADVWSNLPRLHDSLPAGAGLCVRRNVAQHYRHLHDLGQRSFQLDRAGASLLSGGDNDLAASACDLGLGVGLIASLKLTHLIPPERLTADYLARLAEGIAFSSTLLDFERGTIAADRGVVGKVADLVRALRLRQPHRAIVGAAYRGRTRAVRMRRSPETSAPGKKG